MNIPTKSYIPLSAILAILLGLLSLLEHYDIFSVYPAIFTTIRMNTAVCFVLAGSALLVRNIHARFIFHILNTAVAIIAISNIVTYIITNGYEYNEGHTRLEPAAMSLITAVCFVTMSLSLLMALSAKEIFHRLGQYGFHFISIVSFIVISAYLFKVDDLFNLKINRAVSLYPSLGLFFTSLAATFINPHLGITGIFRGNLLGAVMARKLFPYILVIIVILAWLRIEAHWGNWVPVDFGIYLFASAFVLVSLFLIAKTAKDLNDIDAEKLGAKEQLRNLNKSLEERISERTRELHEIYSKLLEKERKVHASNEMFTRLFELSPVAMTIHEGNGFPLVKANDAFLRLINKPKELVINKTTEEIAYVPEEDLQAIVDELTAHGIIRNKESRIVTASGEKRTCLASSVLFSTDEQTRTFSIFLDITDRKQMEEKLRELNHQLEEAVHEQKSLNDQLALINTQKDNILAIVAHDLRNPISGIATICRTLLIEKDLDREIRPYLEVIHESCDDMMHLAHNLIDLTRIERGAQEVHTREVEISEILKKQSNQFKTSAQHKGIALRIANEVDDNLMHVDDRILGRILENLLSNALKFSPRGSAVELVASEDSEHFRFTVQDNGPGLSEADQKMLFQKYSRLSTRPTNYEPTMGLGMSIIKELTSILGGEIQVQTEVGKGTTFNILLRKK